MSSRPISPVAEFHVVRSGDTLAGIADAYGTTTANLIKLNNLSDLGRLTVAQRLRVRRKQVCVIVPLFIDRDRNPIKGLRYRVESMWAGVFEGVSQLNGLGERFVTPQRRDTVRILVSKLDGSWKLIHETKAEYGEKLITLKSGKIKLRTRTEPHPQTPEGLPVEDPPSQAKPVAVPPGTPMQARGDMQHPVANGADKGLKAEFVKSAEALPVTRFSKDRPDLRKYFVLYTGETITAEDWAKAAGDIGCEPEVIKAFAHVESRGAGFDTLHRPVILYERHKFSIHTNGRFDAENADISSRKRYTDQKVDKQGNAIADADRHGHSYERFERAYLLSAEGAIQACSWGKFQVLGENYRALKFDCPQEFLEVACESERLHLAKLFVPFVMTKHLKSRGTLRDALIKKDWANAAYLYNGPGYKEHGYDRKIKQAYEKIKNGSLSI